MKKRTGLRSAKKASLLAGLLLLLSILYCKRPEQPRAEKFARELPKMNTLVRITVYGTDREKAEKGLDAAFERIDGVEKLMSAYKEESEVSCINREAAHKPVPISGETFNLIEKSIEISRKTKGAFDITVGPLLQLWKSAGEKGVLPFEEELAAAKERVGYENMELNREAKTLRFKKEGMRIDLGGIAKGYAIDCAIQTLRQMGFDSALVDAGGDCYAMGSVGKRDGWDIGVQKPIRRGDPSQPPALACTIRVKDMAVVSSGNYERYVEIGENRYSHIVDPRTGMALSEGLVQVTLIGGDATTADAFCTALMVMGTDKAQTFINTYPEFEAFFFESKKGRRFSQTLTEGVGKYIIRKPKPSPKRE